MEFNRMIALYMDDCHARQLRPKTMQSYEQSLRLFSAWLEESFGVARIDGVKDVHIRSDINDLQKRGKYTCVVDHATERSNYPQRRRDYQAKVSNITINNYLRNLRALFSWLVEVECGWLR